MAALSNLPYMERVRDALVAERRRLFDALAAVPYLQPFPSHSNFILCKVGAKGRGGGQGTRGQGAQRRGQGLGGQGDAGEPGRTSLHDNLVETSPRVADGRDARGTKDALAQEHGIVAQSHPSNLPSFQTVVVCVCRWPTGATRAA